MSEPRWRTQITGVSSEYDKVFVNEVYTNWYGMLNGMDWNNHEVGDVVLRFRLHSDGRVTGMMIVSNSVSDFRGYICEKAILEGVPYPPWTEAMSLTIGDECEVQFAFDYR